MSGRCSQNAQEGSVTLPSKVSKGLVGLGHFMRIFLLLYGPTFVIGGSQKLGCQFIGHRLVVSATGVLNKPPNRQSGAPFRTNFHRDLVVGATHSARFYFESRLDVSHRLVENLQTLLTGFLFQKVKRPIQNVLGGGPLASLEQAGRKLRYQGIPIPVIERH
jgi:hypothetical protein